MYIHEHVIAKSYHWSLEDIRNMDYYDFQVHLQLCLVRDNLDKEFALHVAGHKKPKNTAPDSKLLKGSGTVKEVRTEKLVHF